MGGVGELTHTVSNGVAGLVGGAATALVDAFWTIVGTGQQLLPGPLFPIVVGALFLGLAVWTLRK